MRSPDARRYDFIGIGDPVLDIVVHCEAMPAWGDKQLGQRVQWLGGGCEANAVCAASRLGLRTALFGRIGHGAVADLHRADLVAHGVASEYLRTEPGSAGATAIVYVSPAGERAVSYVPVAPSEASPSELKDMLSSTRSIYTLPYDATTLRRLSAAAHEQGTSVIVDVERAAAAMPGMALALAESADLLCFNEAGFRQLCAAEPTFDVAARLLERMRAKVLVVSLGAQGAMAVDRTGQRVRQGAYPAQVVDTTGAGDAFNAAFAAGWLHELPLPEALSQACAAASFCVEAIGARTGLPTAEQVAARQRQQAG